MGLSVTTLLCESANVFWNQNKTFIKGMILKVSDKQFVNNHQRVENCVRRRAIFRLFVRLCTVIDESYASSSFVVFIVESVITVLGKHDQQ